MKKITLYLTIFLVGCSSLVSQDKYPSIEKECEISGGLNSEQCKIANKNDWSQIEKEHHMGFIYFFSNMGVTQDCNKAKYWFEKAAKKGNAKSLDGLGGLYFTGCGVDKDFKKAEGYYLLAEEKGSRNAKANLGDLYREGGYRLDKDLGQAMYWYELAINDTPARAYNGIASSYIDQENYVEAYKNIVKAAELEYPEAEYNLGYMYYNGIVVEQNKKEARIWFEKAAAKGYIDAEYYLNILLKEMAE